MPTPVVRARADEAQHTLKHLTPVLAGLKIKAQDKLLRVPAPALAPQDEAEHRPAQRAAGLRAAGMRTATH